MLQGLAPPKVVAGQQPQRPAGPVTGEVLPDPVAQPREFLRAVFEMVVATDKEGYFLVRGLLLHCLENLGKSNISRLALWSAWDVAGWMCVAICVRAAPCGREPGPRLLPADQEPTVFCGHEEQA